MSVSQNSFLSVFEQCRQAAKSGNDSAKEKLIIELTELAGNMQPEELEKAHKFIKQKGKSL